MAGDSFIRDVPGVGMAITPEGMALIFGVSEDEFMAVAKRPDGADGPTYSTRFPDEWLRNGRRRYREAAAACGSDLITDVLSHLRKAA